MESTKSKSQNEYFDVKMKISTKEFQVIRVMKRTNSRINRRFFLNMQGKAVVMKNVSKSTTDIIFYNSYYGSTMIEATTMPFKFLDVEDITIKELKEKSTGRYSFIACFRWIADEKMVEVKNNNGSTSKKRLRDGVVLDESEEYILITIWEEHIDILKDSTCYLFNNISIRDYLVKKLVTTPSTTIEMSDKFESKNLNWSIIDMESCSNIEAEAIAIRSPKLIALEIISVSVAIFPSCCDCKKQVEIPPGETKITCIHCNKRLLTRKLDLGFTSTIVVCKENRRLKLTLFPDVLNKYFGRTDIVNEYLNEPVRLEDKILDLDQKVDITYNATRNIVSDITDSGIDKKEKE